MAQDYKVEQLKNTFLDHSEMAKAHHAQVIAQFKEQFPDQELPETLKNEFNVSEALASICKEIVDLKEIVQRLVNSQLPKN